MTVPLAVTLPVPSVDAATSVELVQKAASWGYDACWASEVQGPDAFTSLGALATTTDLDLGVAVVPAQTRTTFVLGMTAVSLAELSGGRFALGIGASSELIVEQWGGVPYDAPLTAVRETYQALRPVLAGERATYEGEVVRMRGYRPHATPDEPVPLYLGALNPRSLEMVGELDADGLCLNQMRPAHVPEMLDRVAAGAGGEADLPVVARLFCGVTDDVEAARGLVKHVFAPYIAVSAYNRFYRWQGFEEEATAVSEAAEEGDRDAMTAAVSDRLVDEVFCLGSPGDVAARIGEFVDAGVDVPVVAPLAGDAGEAEQVLRSVARAWHDRAG